MFFTIPSSFAGLPELPDQFVVDFHQGSLRTLRTRCDKSPPLTPLRGGEENQPKSIYYIEMLRLILAEMKAVSLSQCYSATWLVSFRNLIVFCDQIYFRLHGIFYLF